MSDQRDGGISWTDETWNPVRGCSRVSEGCRNCYAEGVAARFSAPGLAYHGLARQGDHGPRWTGKLAMVPGHLDDPIRWKRPRRIFVNSMSDLFHEQLTNEEILSVFLVMLNAPRHTYQILTKRAERMHDFVRWFNAERGELPENIWLGISAEDQENAEARIPWLIRTNVKVRFVSAEPLLGRIFFLPEWLAAIAWVIFGGESGRNARPYDVDWARMGIAQCRAYGTCAFHKQLGAKPFDSRGLWTPPAAHPMHGPEIETWDADFAVRDFPLSRAA